MKGRFQRGKIGGISPFFAFQDIITSAMAVLITVVMLLALNMGEPGHAAPGEPGEPMPPQLRQQLASLLDELSRATAALRVAQDASAAAKLNPAALRVEIEIMRGEIASIQAISRAGTKGLRSSSEAMVPKLFSLSWKSTRLLTRLSLPRLRNRRLKPPAVRPK